MAPPLRFALAVTTVGVVLIGFYPPAAAAIGEMASTHRRRSLIGRMPGTR